MDSAVASEPMAASPAVPASAPAVMMDDKTVASTGGYSTGFYSGQASASVPVTAASTTTALEADTSTKLKIEQVEKRIRQPRGDEYSELIGATKVPEVQAPEEAPTHAAEPSLSVPSGIFKVPSSRWAEFGDMTLRSR